MEEVLHYTFLKKLQNLIFVKSIILYGSRANGQAAPRADMDLAILCPDASPEEWSKVIDVVENADTLLKVDCVRLDTLADTNPLKTNIIKEGIVLYQK